VTQPSSLQRLLQHAQRLTGLTSSEQILTTSCREMVRLTGASAAFASCCLPGHTWETGLYLESRDDDVRAATPAARSALFALHRRLAAETAILTIERAPDTTAIFAGLGCSDEIAAIHAIPIVHRRKRLWGELVLVGGTLETQAEGIGELAQLATVALENAERLAFARRDQDRLLLLAEATNDALYDWHFDTRDFWWGGGILKLLGSDADPVEHTSRWKLERIHPGDVARVRASFEDARASKAMTWTSEYRFRRQDGSYLDVCDRGYFLRHVDGRAYRMIGSIQDVTAMKSLLAREQQARAEAEAASRAKDEFLAMLGHELRNPLAPIVTGLDLLRMRAGASAEREVMVLQRQAQNMIRLVDDLLDISRITHGKIQLEKERFELAAIVSSAIETARPLIDSRGHTLTTKVPHRGLLVDADRSRLAQAIANLLTNAAKYTEPGGQIAVLAKRDGDAIEIVVRDNGIGIAPGMLPHIFSMFVQERQALDRSQGGLGLGLCIVRSIVDLHGGTVEAFSAGRGKGSQLTIRLPAARTRVGTDTDEITQPIVLQPPGGRRIIVVDDNQDAADLLSIALEQLGNTTRVAHDAEAALQVIDEFRPEVAVLDIGLPVVDGYELARLLRQRGKRIRLIAVTGYGQESDKERAVNAGFDAHLVKPVHIDRLRTVIESLSLLTT
jgi:signal transduction histidine kinase/CheY-like chemotaxis protein